MRHQRAATLHLFYFAFEVVVFLPGLARVADFTELFLIEQHDWVVLLKWRLP